MTSGLLKPLVVFCSQSQSQRYIKTIRNLGDAWRSLSEQPLLESEKDSVLVETNFDFVLRITTALEEQRQSKPTIVEMLTHESPLPDTSLSTELSASSDTPRHYRIFADYGTDFIWRDPDDLRPEEGDCMLEAEEILSSFPPSVFELYDAWVDTYTNNFKERREQIQDYHAMAPQVGRIEFSAGCSKYYLEKGKETDVTLAFLQDQVEVLAKGKPVA